MIESIYFTDKDIFKKIIKSFNDTELFILNYNGDSVIWEKYFSLYNINLNNYSKIDIDRLSYTINNDENQSDKSKYLMIYKTNESNILNSTMKITNPSSELIWDDCPGGFLSPPFKKQFANAIRFRDILTHIDLTKEFICPNDNYNSFNKIINNDKSINSNQNDKLIVMDILPDSDNEEGKEYRIDPYDECKYTKSEFKEYYGGLIEWNFQNPKNILLRNEYYKFTELFSELDKDKFIFLFKQYEKTFH